MKKFRKQNGFFKNYEDLNAANEKKEEETKKNS